MKNLITNSNPFVLILIPVAFAMVMGLSYQLNFKGGSGSNGITADCAQATSLFTKSVGIVKTVCAVAKQKLW